MRLCASCVYPFPNIVSNFSPDSSNAISIGYTRLDTRVYYYPCNPRNHGPKALSIHFFMHNKTDFVWAACRATSDALLLKGTAYVVYGLQGTLYSLLISDLRTDCGFFAHI